MTTPRRILFLSAYTGLGGGETALVGLLSALDRTRLRAALLTPREGPLGEAARGLGIETHVVPYRGASVWYVPAVWARLPATTALAEHIRSAAPDLVDTDFHSLPFAAPACRGAGVPLVFTCWGWWFRPRPWQRQVYRRGVDAILACSEAIKRGFLGAPPFMAPERVRVMYPGVDPAVFRPRPGEIESLRRALDLPARGPLVTMLARFQHVKGHDVFLEAARIIASRAPEVTFVMAGENVFGGARESAYKHRILSTVAADPVLRSRVRWLGWVPASERLLAASDVLVCSSRFESVGMVPVEAMSCGVPVVSTNVGGPAETIVDGVTGFLVPPERPDEIAGRVMTLLSNPEQRRIMGEHGRARVVESFTLTRYASAFQDVVSEVLARRANGLSARTGEVLP
jgi:glycosyltransferase involved in cell wall biosynthesis